MWDLFKASGMSPLPRSYHTSTPVVNKQTNKQIKKHVYNNIGHENLHLRRVQRREQ